MMPTVIDEDGNPIPLAIDRATGKPIPIIHPVPSISDALSVDYILPCGHVVTVRRGERLEHECEKLRVWRKEPKP